MAVRMDSSTPNRKINYKVTVGDFYNIICVFVVQWHAKNNDPTQIYLSDLHDVQTKIFRRLRNYRGPLGPLNIK